MEECRRWRSGMSGLIWDAMYQNMLLDIYDVGLEELTLRYHALIKGSRDITEFSKYFSE
jgi:hypothetical protein